jgi:hypothetical protein
MSWATLGGGCALVILLLPLPVHAGQENPCLACDRQMRKTFEAIQAWRRLHSGNYPGLLVDLENSGLLPKGGAICPELLGERSRSSAKLSEKTSRGPQRDPEEFYEYELTDSVLVFREYLPADALNYNRQQVKSVLLQRQFFEQVAILRCTRHSELAPTRFANDRPRRNLTVTGNIYWSGLYWEQLWLNDVPYCAREANVLFGLKGPPFHTDKGPTLPSALDLRTWSCSFGDHVWWWTYPMFEAGTNRQKSAHLRPLFQENHGRVLSVNAEEWWLDGLVQLQGQISTDSRTLYSAPSLETFVWKKTGAAVGRSFRQAAWLQGTLWTAPAGETAGWLVWHYADGNTERVPIIYGRNTARFWGDQSQIDAEKDFTKPVWSQKEDKASVGKDRLLRIYRQEWANPRPDVVVASLDFVSNPESRASPFLIAVNVLP